MLAVQSEVHGKLPIGGAAVVLPLPSPPDESTNGGTRNGIQVKMVR
jgi:hypothetical protein